jgi:hypothetical protein
MGLRSLFRSVAMVATLGLLQACASVPMAPAEQDAASKTFTPPADGQAGLYVFRNSFVGKALKKDVYLDGALVGETANKVYFRRVIPAGAHTLATESEFGNNSTEFTAEPGKLYFFEQYIKMGLFVGGANLRAVSEEEGKKEVLKCKEALGSLPSPSPSPSPSPPPPQP